MICEIIGRASVAKSFVMVDGNIQMDREEFARFALSFAYDILYNPEKHKELEETLLQINEDF